jgi:hypothetical protein
MSSGAPDPPYYRKTGGTSFEPRFTLSVIYLFVFFFLWCMLLIAPALMDVLQNVPTGPAQEEAAKRVAQETIQPRMWIAGLGSAVSTVAGVYYRVLPGFRHRR